MKLNVCISSLLYIARSQLATHTALLSSLAAREGERVTTGQHGDVTENAGQHKSDVTGLLHLLDKGAREVLHGFLFLPVEQLRGEEGGLNTEREGERGKLRNCWVSCGIRTL